VDGLGIEKLGKVAETGDRVLGKVAETGDRMLEIIPVCVESEDGGELCCKGRVLLVVISAS
jgi:hypothetical protein